MRLLKYFTIFGFGSMWLYSIYANMGILLNIILGILLVFFMFIDQMILKPIELTRWDISKEKMGDLK